MKYNININCSYGEEENIEVEAVHKLEAFNKMIDLATREAKEVISAWPEDKVEIEMNPSDNKIILYYGHNYEYCVYILSEMEV